MKSDRVDSQHDNNGSKEEIDNDSNNKILIMR